MEQNNKMKKRGENGLAIVDMLCSTGYLPPRNERDLERFERIYSDRRFETETYSIDADTIFDSVIHDSLRINANKDVRLIADHSQLKAASSATVKRKLT